MSRIGKRLLLLVAIPGLFAFIVADQATAQVAVTAYYPARPAAAYYPARWGLFGRRLVYRPVMAYPAPVTAYYPPAPVTRYYAPAPVTTYYAPPVTTYYAPTPVTTYYAPAAVPVTTYYAPVYAY